MNFFDDFKVLTASFVAIVLSYINTPLDGFRYLVLIATLCYTIRKWYIMEKRNKNNKK
ncbi:hypothetical protein [Maribacter sp. ACAM166]|uniref:hypothetical protein n=1 Tax=Maribacter sp. ACAM166 TaxID=2508996 RepID=UPI0014858181|nr:hypothetical protein [Maribacter sp. ACAM166]